MAYTHLVSQSPATGAIAMYQLISTLMSAGWLKKMDSDGTTYSSSGVQVTSGGTSTNGLGNNSAWVRLQAPAVNGGSVSNQKREIIIQRGTLDIVYRIKYSASAGFTGGSPGSVQVPSAADEVIMSGAGTDASPTYSTIFPGNATYHWHIACGGAAEFYSFYAFANPSATPTIQSMILLDVMATNSFPLTDPDPAVFYVSGNTNSAMTEIITANAVVSNVTNPAKARAWLGGTSNAGILTSGTNNQNVNLMSYTYWGNTSNAFGSNPFSGKDDLVGFGWGRNASGTTTPNGWKGYSTLFYQGSMIRTPLDTADTVGTKDRIYIAGAWGSWNNTSPVI